MSQRNWKTTQRKTNRNNVLQNFASRPINALSSIKETSSTASHSMQSSTSDSSNQQDNQEAFVQQDLTSSSSPNNDVYQIIEEECLNNSEDYVANDNGGPKSPPEQAFQQDDSGLRVEEEEGYIQDLMDLDREIEHDHNLGESNGEANKGSSTNDAYDDMDEDDDNNPIIYAHHDDDSISQITSSVAGYSVYSSDHALSRQLNNDDGSNKNKVPAMNHGGVSHMRPNMAYGSNSYMSQNTNLTKRTTDNSNEEKSPLMEDEELNKFFGVPDGKEPNDIHVEEKGSDDLIDVDIYTDNNDRKRYAAATQHYADASINGGDDLTLRDMYSIEPSLSTDSRRTFSTDAQNDNSFASMMQKARLKAQSAFIKVKHVVNKYIPMDGDSSSNIEQKKNDDLDQYSTSQFTTSQYSTSQYSTSTGGETDYFGMLMSSNFVSSSSNVSLYRFRNRKENQVNFLWISCLLVLIWLLLYLAKIGNDSAWEQRQMQKRGNKFQLPLRTSGMKATDNSPLHEDINVADVEVFRQGKTLPTFLRKDKKAKNGQGIDPNTAQEVPPSPPVVVNDVPLAPPAPVIHIKVDSSHIGMELPDLYNNILDVTEKNVPQVPYFWHIPRTAGATINEILSTCYHLRLASNAVEGHQEDTTLQVVDVGAGHSYVNTDVSNMKGIQRAREMGLVASGLSDVIVSAIINHAVTLFDPDRKGRIFTMMRHPVMRAASLFYFLQDTQWKSNKELANISIQDYFKRKLGESNWQVRFLTNQVTKPYIDENDLKLAKEILRRKIFVGLTSEREASFNRFQKLFGWNLQNQADVECLNNHLQWDWALKHPHQLVEEGTEVWDLISAHNKYDVELFEYAKILFQEQEALL